MIMSWLDRLRGKKEEIEARRQRDAAAKTEDPMARAERIVRESEEGFDRLQATLDDLNRLLHEKRHGK